MTKIFGLYCLIFGCNILNIQVRAGMCLPRDFQRAQQKGNTEENLFLPELGCVVNHFLFKLEEQESFGARVAL
jgi:hypothetical protein